MIRISYCIDGINVEEIITPDDTIITREMFENLRSIYVFSEHKNYAGLEAKEKCLEFMSRYTRAK